MFEKRIEIRWSDLDSSRHVNNAVYLTYLEEVRTGWIAAKLGGDVHAFVLARVEVDFRRELTLEDEVAIGRCSLERLGTSSIRTTEQIVTRGGDVVADAVAVIVAWDGESSRRLTDAERRALES